MTNLSTALNLVKLAMDFPFPYAEVVTQFGHDSVPPLETPHAHSSTIV